MRLIKFKISAALLLAIPLLPSPTLAAPQASAVPGAPRNFRVVSFDGSKARLAWSDPDQNEESFVVERSVNGITWEAVTIIPRNATRITIADLSGSPTWSFRIRGFNRFGRSQPSRPTTVWLARSTEKEPPLLATN